MLRHYSLDASQDERVYSLKNMPSHVNNKNGFMGVWQMICRLLQIPRSFGVLETKGKGVNSSSVSAHSLQGQTGDRQDSCSTGFVSVFLYLW